MEKPFILFDRNEDFSKTNMDKMQDEYVAFIFISTDTETVKPVSGILKSTYVVDFVNSTSGVLEYKNIGKFNKNILYTGRELKEVTSFKINLSYRLEIPDEFLCIGYYNGFLFFMDMSTESPHDVYGIEYTFFDTITIREWDSNKEKNHV